MSKLTELLLNEFDQEAVTTRKMFSRIPEDKYDWRPHPKSMTLCALATHIAELPGWVGMAVSTDGLDFAENPYQLRDVQNNRGLMDYFEESYSSGREQLANAQESKFDEPWTLRNGDTVYVTCSKYEMMRMSLHQIVHHRAQLGVFLRLLDIPIPGSYGPSADENAM